MIAATWEPAYRLLLVIGTMVAVWGAGWLVCSVAVRVLDAHRHRSEPEWELLDAQARATRYLKENQP